MIDVPLTMCDFFQYGWQIWWEYWGQRQCKIPPKSRPMFELRWPRDKSKGYVWKHTVYTWLYKLMSWEKDMKAKICATQEKKVWCGALLILLSSYFVATRLEIINLNPSVGIFKAENFVFSPVFSALVAFTVISPLCMEITQPGLPCSGVHK